MLQLQPTGRRYTTLTGELAEEVDPRRVGAPRYLVLTFDARYRSLPALRTALAVGRSFLEAPMVPGIVPLVLTDVDAGRLVYATGEVWSLAEILDAAASRRVAPSPRAAAEVGWWVANLLLEAAEAGESAGVFSHGDLSPWRVLVRADGDVALLGYGVPDVEMLRVRHARADASSTPTCRYAPPERMVGRPEDVRSDLYSLGIVMADLALGVPLSPTDADGAWKVARDGGHRALWDTAGARVSKPLSDVIRRLLAPTPSERLGAAEAIGRMARVLETLDGDGLDALVARQAADDVQRARSPSVRPLDDVDASDGIAVEPSATLQARRVAVPSDEATLRPPAPVAVRSAPRRALPRPSPPAPPSVAGDAASPERPARAAPSVPTIAASTSSGDPAAPSRPTRPAPPAAMSEPADARRLASPSAPAAVASSPARPARPMAPTAPQAGAPRPARAITADADAAPEDDPTA
jgi:hypothetical protein